MTTIEVFQAAALPQVQGFSDERIRLLAAICREMQFLVATNSFFLPTRKLGEILGVHWTQAGRWLRALEVLKVIHLAPGEVRKRGGNRSPRYHYGPCTRKADVLIVTPLAPSEPAVLLNGDEPNSMKVKLTADPDESKLLTPAGVDVYR